MYVFNRKYRNSYNLYSSKRKKKKKKKIDEKGEEVIKNIYYIFHFTDSARFMASSLSNLANNFSEGIHRIKCKFRHNDKNVKHAEL